eukprot:CAMPEP_0177628564 /NCGR_PEP_ID=MMETSP0447-20121125/198_1 /TAXON_ID=0 /ORGANISM="Stygamoeba regulata, Strain BSH-02190019" /LENGTH=43 /DNA_ID= /DNA_START= /DNA_END= /DNA_ORIENTATION=
MTNSNDAASRHRGQTSLQDLSQRKLQRVLHLFPLLALKLQGFL